LQAEHYLAEDQQLADGVVAHQPYPQKRRDQRQPTGDQAPLPAGNTQVEVALHDHLPGDGAGKGGALPGGQQRDTEQDAGERAPHQGVEQVDGINTTYRYGELLNHDKEFLDFLNENGISIEHRNGVVVRMNQDVAKTKIDTEGTLEGLMASQTQWLELLSTLGIATKPLNYIGQEIKNKCVAITGNFLNTLSDEAIQTIFTRNFVLLDGDAVVILDQRNLLNLINATSIEVLKNRSGQQSFEQFDGETISGINDPRLTMLTHTGDYVKIKYQPSVKVHSSAYDRFENKLGPVTVSGDKFYCLPMMDSQKYGWQAQYTDIREGDLKHFFEEQLSVPHLVNMYNCKMVIDDNQSQMIISNWSIDDVDGINFFLKDRNVRKVSITYRDANNQMQNEVLDVSLDADGIYHVDFTVK